MRSGLGLTLFIALSITASPGIWAQNSAPPQAAAQLGAPSKNLAPNFSGLSKSAKVVMMSTDVELFSISGGGVLEPKADWTEAASRHFKEALGKKSEKLGLSTQQLDEKDAENLADVNDLHGAIAQAIALHHFGPGFLSLPTKAGKLDWSLGDAVRPLRERSGADYALFSWIRDSYASSERKAAIVALALLGVGVGGGVQIGYMSLVDLNTGQVMWFNRLLRGSGDLREPAAAAETLDALMTGFPIKP